MAAAAATWSRFVPALGALLAGASVALSAYAAHAGAPGLASAAWLGLIHGAACAALAPDAVDRLSRCALAILLAGAWLFAGSLAAKHFLGTSSAAAPAGGMLMIAGWVLYAVSLLRR